MIGVSKTKDQNEEHVKQRLQPILEILPSIAEGDFSKRLEVPKKTDEFTELYASINYMLEDLNENLKERRRMEETLKEKTIKLERFAKLSVGKEKKMIELKKKIIELEAAGNNRAKNNRGE